MAQVNGSVLGNLSGKLGNLSARTRNGKTILSARPSSFNASQDESSLEVRKKFAVTSNFAKFILSLVTLAELWKKIKEPGISVINKIFKSNFPFSAVDKPSEQNIITPGGFPLPVQDALVGADKITGDLPALNTVSVFGADEVNLSADALVCFYNPVSENDPPYQIISLSKEVAGFNFEQIYNLQIDFNVLQIALAAKYQNNILYLAVTTKTAEGKVVQCSATYSKLV